MTLTVTTSTVTVDHDGVFVTASGRVKIAATPGKYWRVWIYDEVTDVWEQQREVFKRREDAEAAAAQVDQLLRILSA